MKNTILLLACVVGFITGCGGGNQQPPQAPAAPGGIDLGAPPPAGTVPAPPAASTPPTQPPPPAPSIPGTPPAVPPGTPSAPGALVPPRGASSGGQGGQAGLDGVLQQGPGVEYYLFTPRNYNGAPTPMLLVFTGVEGAVQQSSGGLLSPLPGETTFLRFWIPSVGLSNHIICILDTPAYYQKGVKEAALAQLGVAAMDHVRSRYNVDNDRTSLLGQSMGTKAGQEMGFRLRQSWFAAYYLNDVVAVDQPAVPAAQLGFAPHSQVGPGGAYDTANKLVANLRAAGYRVPAVAPYNGPGSQMHGSPEQLMEAYRFFAGKTRQ